MTISKTKAFSLFLLIFFVSFASFAVAVESKPTLPANGSNDELLLKQISRGFSRVAKKATPGLEISAARAVTFRFAAPAARQVRVVGLPQGALITEPAGKELRKGTIYRNYRQAHEKEPPDGGLRARNVN